MYFDRFDVCEAWYLALVEYHGGQGSWTYKRLGKLLKYFKPSPMLRGGDLFKLTPNGQEIYMRVCRRLALLTIVDGLDDEIGTGSARIEFGGKLSYSIGGSIKESRGSLLGLDIVRDKLPAPRELNDG